MDVQDVIGTFERVWLAAEVEGEVWEAGNCIAVNGILAIPGLLGTNLSVDHLSNVGGESNQGSACEGPYHNDIQGYVEGRRLTGVNGSASVLEFKVLTAEGNLVQFNLPVGLSAHGGICELAFVGGGVDTTKGSFSSVFLRGPHAESEHRFVKKALVHKVVEWRDDVVDGDGVVSEAEDTVESRYYGSKRGARGVERGHLLAKGEGETWFLGSLSEVHAFHGEIAHFEVVVRNEAFHGTRTVVNFEISSVGGVGRRGARIVFRVEEARDGRALGTGDPKVTRPKADK